MLGDKIPENDEHWELLITLLEIMSVIFAPAINSEATFFLQHQIADHFELFKELFPDARVIPKQHFLTHYPRCIRLVGPLVNFWAMRFEAKHNFFRRLAHIVCNFKNFCKTMALRHQMAQCYRFYSQQHIDSKSLEVGKGSMTVLAKIKEGVIISGLLNSYGVYEDIYMAHWVKYHGIVYRPTMGLVVSVDTESENSEFGRILYVFVQEKTVHFIFEVWHTMHLDRHLFAYCVEKVEPQMLRATTPKSLLDYQPVQFRHSYLEGNNKYYVVMKHKPWY